MGSSVRTASRTSSREKPQLCQPPSCLAELRGPDEETTKGWVGIWEIILTPGSGFEEAAGSPTRPRDNEVPSWAAEGRQGRAYSLARGGARPWRGFSAFLSLFSLVHQEALPFRTSRRGSAGQQPLVCFKGDLQGAFFHTWNPEWEVFVYLAAQEKLTKGEKNW